MMRFTTGPVLALALSGCLWAQTPPTTARDITQMPPASSSPASSPTSSPASFSPTGAEPPSAVVAAPPSVLRVYVDSLTGADPAAIAGLISQSLFQSNKVVVTENQSNASLILKGTVQREALPGPKSPKRRAGATSSPAPDGTAAMDLPALDDTSAPTDLSKYLYRLDLQLLNPDGDLVWMSGRGHQALPFTNADAAVEQTLQPMLASVARFSPASGGGQ